MAVEGSLGAFQGELVVAPDPLSAFTVRVGGNRVIYRDEGRPGIGEFPPFTGRPKDGNMSALPAAPLVHFYNTRLRTILCGLRGFEHRSTKHAHGVTCPACIGLLGKRPPASAQPATERLA